MGAVIPGAGCAARNSSASGAQVIDGSLKFNGDDQYLTKTFGSAGNRRTFTFSFWVKRTEYGATNMGIFSEYPGSGNGEYIRFSDDSGGDTFRFYSSELSAQSLVTQRAFRDNGWYHICVAVDTSEATNTDRVKIYINGERNIDWASATWPSQDAEYDWLTASAHYIGRCQSGSYFPGSLSQFYVIDGAALEATDFGYTDPLTNTWRPKKFSAFNNPNAGIDWSDASNYTLSGTGASVSTLDAGFDGSLSASSAATLASSGNTTANVVFNCTATKVTLVEVFVHSASSSGDTRGTCLDSTGTTHTSATLTSASQDWHTIYSGPAITLANVGWGINQNGTSGTGSDAFRAFRVNGYVLINDAVDNSFYLPMDGSAPIGTDQSGNGNDWRQVNFGGSLALDKATGALPIRNTVSGGKVAGVGVRKDYSPHTANIVKESGCVYFDGAYDCIYTPDSSDFSVGSGDFTLELWFYRTRSGGDDWMAIHTDGTSANSGVGLHVWSTTYGGSDANKIHGRVRIGSSNINCTGTTVIGTSSWHHAAFVRDGTNLRIYLDGVQEGVTAVSTDAINDPAVPFIVGAVTALGEDGIKGYLSNVRYVVGTCLYPSGTTFIPPTEPLTAVTNTKLLCCQSATDATAYAVSPAAFTKVGDTYATDSESSGSCVLALPLVGDALDVSNKINSESTAKTTTVTNAVGITTISNFYSGSYFFDGSGDYIVVTNNSEFVFEEEPFTIECWMYADSYMGLTYPTVISKYDNGDASWILRLKSDGNIVWYAGQVGGGTNNESTTQPISLGRWIHLAVVRKGTGSNETKVYVDGLLQLTCTDSSDYDDTNNIYIGRQDSSNANEFDGYIQDVRIYKGVEKYTNDFIPASTNPHILPDTPSGVALGSELTKLTHGSGAVKFDGTGDVIYAADSADFTLGTNDFTAECWIKRTRTGVDEWFFTQSDATSAGASFGIHIDPTTNYLEGWVRNGDAGSNVDISGTTALGTDVWYHCAYVRDGTTVRLYLNGIQEASSGSLGSATVNDSSATMNVGALTSGGSTATACFLSNVRLVNGTCLYPDGTTFDPPTEPLTAVTNTKFLCCQSPTDATAYTVSPGALTKVNDAAATYSTPFTTDINTVMGQETGYCTWNPLFIDGGGNNDPCTLSNGNLTAASPNSGDWNVAYGSISVSSGKYYWELIHTQGNLSCMFGCIAMINGGRFNSSSGFYYNTNSWTYYMSTGNKRNGSAGGTSYGPAGVNGDVFGVAMDLDEGTISIHKNGISMGIMYDNLPEGEEFTAIWGASKVALNNTVVANFGQKPFKYAPPEGHQPINYANLPSPGVVRSADYVGISTWTGDSAASRNIDIGIKKPDLVWLKNRFVDGRSNYLYDSVRGFGANKEIVSNSTDEQGSSNHLTQNHGYVSGNTINGFTLAEGATNSNYTNQSGQSYVGWAWKAGGNKNTFNIDDVGYASAAAAGLDGGTLTVTGASVGTKQGFSIIKFTGTGVAGSVSHGLTQKPDFIIAKNIDGTANDWGVHHSSLTGPTYTLYLNGTATEGIETLIWPSASTDSVINVGSGALINESTKSTILYSWHDIPGMQKFGSYIGNGTADNGPFVELGFRPAIIIIKRTTSGSGGFNWTINDSERGKYNPNGTVLFPNLANVESTNDEYEIDFLSNGFKLRCTTPDSTNVSGQTYIYAAWAYQPMNNLYGGQSNAR